MKPILFGLSIITIFLFSSCTSSLSEKLQVENEQFSKTFFFSNTSADKIEVQYFSKSNSEILNDTKSIPFFEFVINNTLVSSNEKLWVFQSHSTREMDNNGTEHSLIFEGVKGQVKGLQVVVCQQIFSNSTLVREKLELKSKGESYNLNKLDGKLHFRFPSYSIQNKTKSSVESTEIRIASWEKKPIAFGDKRKGNHMYYPDVIHSTVSDELQTVKGPLSIVSNSEISWFTAYEHASQDDLSGMFDKQKLGSGNLINDAMQGTKGVFNFPIVEDDFKFIGISSQSSTENINISVDVLRGAYLEGEIIDVEHPYSTVWSATGFYEGNNLEDGKEMIRNYLMNEICEKPASRVPEFYYNTWGMQRQDKRKPLRDILTYERIFEEIEYAAELGVDIFVLDDGWENTQGEWFPNSERFTDGLEPIKKRLDKYGLKMGLWYSPMGIDSTTQSYKKHQNWVIKDSEENPIMAQWNHPAFDFVSGFFDVFVGDCKKMIDEGCRFMKWDAINTFYSCLPNLEHGSEKYSEEEIRARYEYLLPIYVVRAMEKLTDYESELIIEIDLTEARRVMVGLAPLSQGKMFWMNNGASWYNDYSTHRTKSMRTIANEFAGIIPLELFTYANYPHNENGAMKYNINNSLLAGHGFWGNLKLMNKEEREWIGKQVKLSKKVLPFLVDVNPNVIGEVGDSPEIYSVVNENEAAGQIVLFSEDSFEMDYATKINSEKVLGVLNHTYAIQNNQLTIPFKFEKKESSVAVFIIPNENSGISIVSSSSELTDVEIFDNKLQYWGASKGKQTIYWDKKNGTPNVENGVGIDFDIVEKDKIFQIIVTCTKGNTKVIVSKS
ncbi:MAG: alpha-galactosidase [Bacteroidetes bacterium]|nr:alpha-galactosidase [Bacteroidota bacterium]